MDIFPYPTHSTVWRSSRIHLQIKGNVRLFKIAFVWLKFQAHPVRLLHPPVPSRDFDIPTLWLTRACELDYWHQLWPASEYCHQLQPTIRAKWQAECEEWHLISGRSGNPSPPQQQLSCQSVKICHIQVQRSLNFHPFTLFFLIIWLLYNSLVNHYFHQSLCRLCVWITDVVWQYGEVGFPLTGAGATVLTLASGTLLNMHTPGSPTTGPAHQLRDKKDGESPFVHDWSWQENLKPWRALGGCFLGVILEVGFPVVVFLYGSKCWVQ